MQHSRLFPINHQPLPLYLLTKLRIAVDYQYARDNLFSDMGVFPNNEAFRGEMAALLDLGLLTTVAFQHLDLHDVLTDLVVTAIQSYNILSEASQGHIIDLLEYISPKVILQNVLDFVPNIVELDKKLARTLCNAIKGLIVINNFMIQASFWGDRDLIEICLDFGANDFYSSIKMALLHRDQALVDYLEVESRKPNRCVRFCQAKTGTLYRRHLTEAPVTYCVRCKEKSKLYVQAYLQTGGRPATPEGGGIHDHEDMSSPICDWSSWSIFYHVAHLKSHVVAEVAGMCYRERREYERLASYSLGDGEFLCLGYSSDEDYVSLGSSSSDED